jgi:two-component system chemotaxis response regulator CheY
MLMMKILLVDHSESIRTIEKTVLEALGNSTFTEAACGLEGLRCFCDAAADPFDLIVIEASVRGLDGMSLVAKIRETDKSVSIAMVTSEVSKERVLEAIKAGVNAYIVKPFTPDVLLQKVRAVLDRKKAAA